jgi:hypothetical protein
MGEYPEKIEDPKLLEIVPSGDGYLLTYDGKPCTTLKGNPVFHKATYLLEEFRRSSQELKEIIEIDFGGDSQPKGSTEKKETSRYTFGGLYGSFCYQRDVIEGEGDEDIAGLIWSDHLLYLDDFDKSSQLILRISNWLKENKIDLPNFRSRLHPLQLQIIDENIKDNICHLESEIEQISIDHDLNMEFPLKCEPKFISNIQKLFSSLNPEEKVFVRFCNSATGDIIFPIAITQKIVAMADYEVVFDDVCGEIRGLDRYIYAYQFGLPQEDILDEIKDGETKTREFKSTLRFNLHSSKNDDTLIHSCLKTISAFLNTEGGKLLIGVADDGGILGIEPDGFKNNDEYERKIYELIRENIGHKASTFVDTELPEINGKFICIVKCKKSSEPVYLNYKKKGEEYFVRTGPGTIKLKTSEAIDYIKGKF